jgi:hypothetical protein
MDEKKDIMKQLNQVLQRPEFKNLPPKVRELLEAQIKSINKVPIPVVTFKENNEWIAITPIIDLAAQGGSEKEALDSLEKMIDDYMKDPDTVKPKIDVNTFIDMHVGLTNIPVNMPLDNSGRVDYNSGQNTPVKAQ